MAIKLEGPLSGGSSMALEGANVTCATSKAEHLFPPLLLSSWGLNNGYGNDSLLHLRERDTGVSSYRIASLGSLM